MATRKKQAKISQTTSVKIERPEDKRDVKTSTFFDRIQQEVTNNQSRLNLLLGILILLVLGVLLFNFFKKPESLLGPSQQTQTETSQSDNQKYTVKEGDTLFLIAQQYYGDGYKFNKIVEANKLSSADAIEVGQSLDIPKDDILAPSAPISPTAPPAPDSPKPSDTNMTVTDNNPTIWGTKITGDTYIVQPGDWLSTIAGRAYGDIYAFDKISQANNIPNSNNIEVGTTLKIPR